MHGDFMSAKTTSLEDAAVGVRVRLAGLWASILSCYIYGDYFVLFAPSKLERMLGGHGPFGPVTQESLLAVAAIMAVPSVMICLSLLLSPAVSRWTNIVVAAIFIVFVTFTLRGASWYFYIFLSAVEVLLKATIIWLAWTWPRQSLQPQVASA